MQGFPPIWSAIVLAFAVLLGVVRLWLWQRSAPAGMRAPLRRVALLSSLQAAAGVFLFFTLHPTAAALQNATIVVATRGASATEIPDGEILVALPEAGALPGAERVPDLATALRRHPEAGRVRILGEGLSARDRDSLALPVEMTPPPQPVGLVEIALPPAVAPGASFAVGGRIGSVRSGTIELVDPAGTIIARAPVIAGGRFDLHGAARTEGIALFELRLRDRGGRLIERLDVPLQTRADPPPRVIAVAGAPGPEMNFLRRWAELAGVDLTVAIDLGAGVRIGEAASPLNSANLASTDLLILDDRSWETLEVSRRGLVTQAVEDGMGLLLRPTGALTGGTRREWTLLGAPMSGDGAVGSLKFPAADDVPHLAQWELSDPGPDVVSAVRAPDGSPLAHWRARGRGRIGVWGVMDSYVLALAGQPDVHAGLWSDLFSVLGRPLNADRPHLRGLARVGERAVVCGGGLRDTVRSPDGGSTGLQIDPDAGAERCAAFWPSEVGWHRSGSSGAAGTPLYIHPAEAGPSLRARDAASASIDLTTDLPAAVRRRAPLTPHWSLAALLALLAALWFIERRRAPHTER
jgi:hypothetical protein